ncbi:phytoene/squalene synthase family protein [Tardiphaga sp.]|uniref:phytoene/squalene synthase family protein n=1 Tax=Tardiphaga sp. TaxID=1926292 RepID=UPI002624C309|nr:phytoene/squalene synthase family protein [Tardiphaga sp.]MDB5616432.1 Phytoene synthase [Tardiphaga sp.]
MSADTDSAAFCARLARQYDFERYAATLFVPTDRRRALLALYAFNAEVSRVRELVSQPLPGEIRLQWWTDMLAGAGHGDVESNPVAAELLLAIRTHELPVDRLTKLIDAHVFDLYNDPMPDLAVLESHINDTVSTLFALSARILGHASDAIEQAADHGGLAQGVVRLIATLPYDSARRQMFLPQDRLIQHGGSAEEVYAGKLTPPIRDTLEQLISGAQEQLATAMARLPEMPSEARRAFLPLALVARDLERVRAEGHDPFVLYVPSRLRTLWMLWRASMSKAFS